MNHYELEELANKAGCKIFQIETTFVLTNNIGNPIKLFDQFSTAKTYLLTLTQ
jgi:hypothetical protein